MQQIETNDPIEARRSRYAQYRGLVATLTFGKCDREGYGTIGQARQLLYTCSVVDHHRSATAKIIFVNR